MELDHGLSVESATYSIDVSELQDNIDDCENKMK